MSGIDTKGCRPRHARTHDIAIPLCSHKKKGETTPVVPPLRNENKERSAWVREAEVGA